MNSGHETHELHDAYASHVFGDTAGIVMTCEHASERVPDGFAEETGFVWPEADRWLRGTHWAYDLGAEAIAIEHARAVGARLVCARGLVLRRRHPRVREVLAQVPYRALVERIAVVRPVQYPFRAVQADADPRTRQWLDVRPDVVQQRLNLAPVDVRADRVVEDRSQQVLVLVAHGVSARWPASE